MLDQIRPVRFGNRAAAQARAHLRDASRDLLVDGLAASSLIPSRMRWIVLRLLGVGTYKCYVKPHVKIKSYAVHIGRGSFINYGCFFDGPVTIGEEVAVGYEVMFATASHSVGPSSHRAGAVTRTPIRVGNGAWIGARAVIGPGVSIGDGCIIAAGSVVTSDCEPNGMYAGVPARRVKELPTG